jgi:hypothetical protein
MGLSGQYRVRNLIDSFAILHTLCIVALLCTSCLRHWNGMSSPGWDTLHIQCTLLGALSIMAVSISNRYIVSIMKAWESFLRAYFVRLYITLST